jgi:hypothetical protein
MRAGGTHPPRPRRGALGPAPPLEHPHSENPAASVLSRRAPGRQNTRPRAGATRRRTGATVRPQPCAPDDPHPRAPPGASRVHTHSLQSPPRPHRSPRVHPARCRGGAPSTPPQGAAVGPPSRTNSTLALRTRPPKHFSQKERVSVPRRRAPDAARAPPLPPPAGGGGGGREPAGESPGLQRRTVAAAQPLGLTRYNGCQRH